MGGLIRGMLNKRTSFRRRGIRLAQMLFYVAAFSFPSASLFAADWPGFQGPLRDGTSPEKGLLREWPAAGPQVLWRTKIKPGWASPSVVGNKVYVCSTEDVRGNEETVACLDANTGEQLWHYTYEVGPYWKRNIGWARGGFRSTPVVDGDRLFTIGALGHLFCFNRHSGEVLWQQLLWDEWNPSGEKGYDFSPIVAEGKLLLWYSDGASRVTSPDAHEVVCRALDPTNGKELWIFHEPHREPARMGEGQTPAIAEFDHQPCLLVTANCELKAIRIADGVEIWKFECVRLDGRGTTIPTPLVVGKCIVNIPDNDVAHVVEVDRAHLDQPAKIVWKKDLDTYTAVHQFRLHEGYLYGFVGTQLGGSEQEASESTLQLACIELATGDIKWAEPGFRSGVALTAADGMLFVRSYQSLWLIEATPEGFRSHGKLTTHDEWRPTLNLLDFVQPVLSNGKLFVRTPSELICFQVSEK